MSELSDEPSINQQIGTLSGDTPLAGGDGLGELTFDSAQPGIVDRPADPMQGLHIAELGSQTSTTTTVDGVEVGGKAPKGLVGYAKKFLGTPYVWGGTTPTGFDCSGFVQYVYGHFGVKLPRISADQARAGKRVALGDMRAGDLVAWDNSSRNNGADHIAIYLGNGLIIEAPRPGRSVQISHLYDTGRAWGVRIKH